MGSSNPVNKAKDAVSGLTGSVQNVAASPVRAATYANPITLGYSLARDLAVRTRKDLTDQAEGQAESDQRAADNAAAAVEGAATKSVDLIALARRRSLLARAATGRSGTILTGGTRLGSTSGTANRLLGM